MEANGRFTPGKEPRYKYNGGWLSPRAGFETSISLTENRTAHHPARSQVTTQPIPDPLSLQDNNENYEPYYVHDTNTYKVT
jgi:hypothetical protein